MTTQDIYAWTQIILLVIVGGGLAWSIRLLKQAVDAQKATIEAQAEQLKAQSTVLHDFELHVKTMKLVVDTVDAPAMLQRMRDYRALTDEQSAAILEQQAKQLREKGIQAIAEARQAYEEIVRGLTHLVGRMLPFLYPGLRKEILGDPNLPLFAKELLQDIESTAPYFRIIDAQSLEQLRSIIPHREEG
jgi:hypothetical protein